MQANTPWVADLMTTPEAEVRAVTKQAVAAVRDTSLECAVAAQRGREALTGPYPHREFRSASPSKYARRTSAWSVGLIDLPQLLSSGTLPAMNSDLVPYDLWARGSVHESGQHLSMSLGGSRRRAGIRNIHGFGQHWQAAALLGPEFLAHTRRKVPVVLRASFAAGDTVLTALLTAWLLRPAAER